MKDAVHSPAAQRWIAGCVALGVISRLALVFRTDREFTIRPYLDDAYYYFSVARSIAHGTGPTVDSIHLTNGFQPLLALLYTPLFWLGGEDWTSIRLTVILHVLIFVASIYTLVRLISRLTAPLPAAQRDAATVIAVVLWTASIQIFNQTMNGLETGLVSLLLLVVMDRCLDIRTEHNEWVHISFGLVLGLMILARIDTALLAVIILLTQIRRATLAHISVQAVTALLVTLPWWLYNVLVFGSLMPTSGQAENIWPVPPGENIHRLVAALTDISLIIGYLPYGMSLFARLGAAVVILIAAFVLLRQSTDQARAFHRQVWVRLLPLAIFGASLTIYYTFFFRAPHFMGRYLQPVRVLWITIASILISNVWSGQGVRARKIMLGIVCIASTLFAVDRYRHNYGIGEEAEFADVASWARAVSPQKVAMLQSGVTGFLAPNVTNLDGKVNFEALRAHQHDSLAEYIRQQHFMYLVDWKPFIDDIRKMTARQGLFYDSIGFIGNVQITRLRDE